MHRFYISYALFSRGYAVTSFGSFVYNADQKDLTNIDLHNIEKTAQNCVIDRFTNATVISINYIGYLNDN